MSSTSISMDEFQALEQRVLRAVEIVKQEREARAAAEAELAALREQLDTQRREGETRDTAARAQNDSAQKELAETRAQIDAFHKERDTVRQRIEKLLGQIDEIA